MAGIDTKKERQSNIELLRILAIMGVIVLHYNNAEMGGGGLGYVAKDSINEWVLRFFESVFICAVDLFVLITGYFMCKSQISIRKYVKLFLEVQFYMIVFML